MNDVKKDKHDETYSAPWLFHTFWYGALFVAIVLPDPNWSWLHALVAAMLLNVVAVWWSTKGYKLLESKKNEKIY